MDPSRSQSLHRSADVLKLGPKMGAYLWLLNDKMMLPHGGCGTLTFEAKAQNDIAVAFNMVATKTISQDGLTDSCAPT